MDPLQAALLMAHDPVGRLARSAAPDAPVVRPAVRRLPGWRQGTAILLRRIAARLERPAVVGARGC